jgi:hypothetical protein
LSPAIADITHVLLYAYTAITQFPLPPADSSSISAITHFLNSQLSTLNLLLTFADPDDDNDYAARAVSARLALFARRSDCKMKRFELNQRILHAKKPALRAWLLACLVAPATLLATGCQSEYAGQTLPSPYYLTDDVQYFAPGPGFKLAREAAAMEEQKAADISEAQTSGF